MQSQSALGPTDAHLCQCGKETNRGASDGCVHVDGRKQVALFVTAASLPLLEDDSPQVWDLQPLLDPAIAGSPRVDCLEQLVSGAVVDAEFDLVPFVDRGLD